MEKYFSSQNTKKHTYRFLLAVIMLFAAVPYLSLAVATVYAPGDSVTVGEFIFNDDFTPTTDICSVRVYNPNGTSLAYASTTLGSGGWQSYTTTAPGTDGTYPSFVECGTTAAGTYIKSDKTFIVKTPSVTNSSIASSVWGNGTRTLTSLGAAAADVWNDTYAATRRLTDGIFSGGGAIATETYVASSTNAILGQIATTQTLIQNLNNISAADVWAYGSRSLNASTTVNLSTISKQEIWDTAASAMTTSGSIGKRIVDNLDAQVSTRGTSNLTAADVWNAASRTLSDYSTSSIASAVWSSGSRTLTNYGNNITAADVWNVLSASLTTTGSIGKQLKDNVDASIAGVQTDVLGNATLIQALNNIAAVDVWNVLSSAVTVSGSIGKQLKDNIDTTISSVTAEVLTNRGLIQSLNNISAADVWAYGARSLNASTTVNLSTASKQEIWDVAAAGLSSTGSIGKKIVDNLDVAVSTRGVSNLSAADVWNSATRTLSDYATSTLTAAIWSNGSRTLSNYGNDITAADVWNALTSSLTTTGSIGKRLSDNIDDSISNVISEVQTNRTLIQSLNNISASDVWAYGARTITGDVSLSTISKQEIWDVAASGLTTSGSIGKRIADNLDTQISSRGISNLTAADVWNAASRTLSDYATSTIAAAVWNNGSRTLTNYGNNITAADVWNVLASSITTTGSIGKQLKDNVDSSISSVTAEVLTNRTLIQNLNNISASDVWSHAARTVTGDVNISTSSKQAIWDVAASSLTSAGSIGKQIADNLDAQISSRGISNLTAADVWASASRTLSDYGTSTIAGAVWANASRTLTNYGNNITAADVWNVLSASLTTTGSIGKQLKDNINDSISNVISEVQTNRTLIQSLNNVSAADIWSYGARSLNASTTVELSTASQQAIWSVAASALTTSGSIGKRIADNLDTTISSRGVSNLTASDVWSAATRSLTDYATTSVAAAVWANGSRTLTNYGNDITAADVWNVLTSSITTSGSVGKLLKDNIDASISSVVTEILGNRTLIQGLNNISAADVWAYGARTVTGDVNLSTSSRQAIWDTAASGLTTSGSVGKKIVDNLDAQVSTRGTSNLTAADVWTAATRSLTSYGTSSVDTAAVAAAVWANGSRTLTNYGNDITAADVWNVLASSLSTMGSIGSQIAGNVDTTISSRATSTVAVTNSNWFVQMSNVERVQTGKTYRTKVFVLNNESQPTAPLSTPTVNLYDDSRNLVVSNIPMTLVSTGVYEYTYTVSALAPQGLWETVVSTEVESGKTIQTNDYWEVSGSPAQVIVNSVVSPSPSSVSANITITNEGLSGYEYQYEWCVVTNVNNQCGGGDDTFHALAAKYINPGDSWNTALTASVPTAGTYYFKLIVYFGTDSSSASRIFTVEAGSGSGSGSSGSAGGGGGSGGGATTNTSDNQGKGCGLTADFNGDCKVNIVDFSILLSQWNAKPPFKNARVDINADGKINSADFSILLSQWSKKK